MKRGLSGIRPHMRIFARLPGILVALVVASSGGCSVLASWLGFEETQREWAGDPAQMNPRHAEESMRLHAELDRIYD